MSSANIRLKKITTEGKYSFTLPSCSFQIVTKMKSFTNLRVLKDLVITDGTACIGGDTLRFCSEFKHVNSVEINPDNFQALEENCEGITNVTLFNKNYLEILSSLRQDVIYLDLPWGGPDYKSLKSVRLMMGDLELHEVVKSIIDQKASKFIFLKAPFNVYMDGLKDVFNEVVSFNIEKIQKPNSNFFYLLISVRVF